MDDVKLLAIFVGLIHTSEFKTCHSIFFSLYLILFLLAYTPIISTMPFPRQNP